jgi:hypothetical protein
MDNGKLRYLGRQLQRGALARPSATPPMTELLFSATDKRCAADGSLGKNIRRQGIPRARNRGPPQWGQSDTRPQTTRKATLSQSVHCSQRQNHSQWEGSGNCPQRSQRLPRSQREPRNKRGSQTISCRGEQPDITPKCITHRIVMHPTHQECLPPIKVERLQMNQELVVVKKMPIGRTVGTGEQLRGDLRKIRRLR